jgi:conjugal transfer/entry exclusion protein
MTDEELTRVKNRTANITALRNFAPKEKSTMEKINQWATTAKSITESMQKVDAALKALQGDTDKKDSGKKENANAAPVDGTYKKVGGSYKDRMNKLIEDSIKNWDVDTNTPEFNSKAARARDKSISARVDRMFADLEDETRKKNT